METSHAFYLLSAIATHAILGYTLARLSTSASVSGGVLGGVAPDLDLAVLLGGVLPVAHRGLLHTPAFVVGLSGAALLVARDRATARGVLVGGLSHLAVDTFTATGVAWLFPLTATRYAVAAGAHGVASDALVWLCCVAALRWRGRLRSSLGALSVALR